MTDQPADDKILLDATATVRALAMDGELADVREIPEHDARTIVREVVDLLRTAGRYTDQPSGDTEEDDWPDRDPDACIDCDSTANPCECGDAPAEHPPTLTLPDGWECKECECHGFHAETKHGPEVIADATRVDYTGLEYAPSDARALGARLIEAADISEQLRAGAR